MKQIQNEIQIDRNELLAVLSEALDRVEIEVFGVTEHHAKRVAWLCVQMGRSLRMSEEEISDLATAALLHDSALIEYREDYEHGFLKTDADGRKHCVAGEENLKLIPGYHMLRGYVLYHHECADGSGPFGKKEEETPLGAQLIHIADEVDLKFALGKEYEEQVSKANSESHLYAKLENIQKYVKEQQGTLFGTTASEAFLRILSIEQLVLTQQNTLEQLKKHLLPMQISFTEHGESDSESLLCLAELFARIIDYKSPFTKCHSIGIAEKAKQMADALGWDEATGAKLYFAGALHDIGKLFVDNAVLEKPGRLDADEYQHIQTHADWTWKLLSKIQGLEEVQRWAAYHHEKLNGKGYPFGKTAEELGEKERLLACLDIYQALTEDRPYKTGMKHTKVIGILQEMAQKGELDAYFIEKIDELFGNGECAEAEKTALFTCEICGYVHETDAITKGFVCPVCGAKETAFSKML